jgi:hypothetical protein
VRSERPGGDGEACQERPNGDEESSGGFLRHDAYPSISPSRAGCTVNGSTVSFSVSV